MNYEILKQDAQKITMTPEAKRAVKERLLEAGNAPKHAPLKRIVPAAVIVLAAVGAGVLLWRAGATPPAVTPDAPGTTLPAQATEEMTQPTNEAPLPQTQPPVEEPTAQKETPPVQQGSANDAADESAVTFPADTAQGNLWILGPGETAPPMPTLIRSFPGYEPVKYYAPKGSYVLSPALSAAIEKYGGDPMVHYYLRISVIDYSGRELTTPDEWEAFYLREIERMRTPEMNGEFSVSRSKIRDATTAVELALYLRDPAFLNNFPASPDCGYIIELFDEQSAVK